MTRTGEWEPFNILFLDGKWVMTQMFTKPGNEVEIKILAEVSIAS